MTKNICFLTIDHLSGELSSRNIFTHTVTLTAQKSKSVCEIEHPLTAMLTFL